MAEQGNAGHQSHCAKAPARIGLWVWQCSCRGAALRCHDEERSCPGAPGRGEKGELQASVGSKQGCWVLCGACACAQSFVRRAGKSLLGLLR
jgi:hypothetical protein